MYRGKPLGTCKGRVMCIKGQATPRYTLDLSTICVRLAQFVSYPTIDLSYFRKGGDTLLCKENPNILQSSFVLSNFTVVQKLLLPPLPYGSLPNNLLNRVQHKNAYFKTAKVIGLLVKSII